MRHRLSVEIRISRYAFAPHKEELEQTFRTPHRIEPFFPRLQSQEMDIELDILSLILLAVIVILLIVPVVVPSDPDTFPFIINNQSQPSKVRHPKESAIYRHRDQPHGYPLITGLSLRKGYEAPRDGDLRDVWEIALQKDVTLGIVRGGKCEFEKLSSRKDELNKLGSGLREIAGEHGKVAIYLPNTIENLLTSFGEAPRYDYEIDCLQLVRFMG
jgi:hypothetical protein